MRPNQPLTSQARWANDAVELGDRAASFWRWSRITQGVVPSSVRYPEATNLTLMRLVVAVQEGWIEEVTREG